MFFIFGFSSRQKELEFNQGITCNNCGRLGSLKVIMEYMYFSLFFIPIIKLNKKYYCVTSCCNSYYRLDPQVGNKVNRGIDVEITFSDLELIQKGNLCSNCGFNTNENFEFCPKCGQKL